MLRSFNTLVLHTYQMFLPSSEFLALLSLRFHQTADLAIKAHVVDFMKQWLEVNFDWNIEASFAAFLEANKDASTVFRGKGSIKVLRTAFETHKKVRGKRKDGGMHELSFALFPPSDGKHSRILSPSNPSPCRTRPSPSAVRPLPSRPPLTFSTDKTTPVARLEAIESLEIARQMALLDEEYYRGTFLSPALCLLEMHVQRCE